MLKISLYQKKCVSLCEHIKTHSYRKNQSYTTDRPATSATGRGLSPRQEPPYCMRFRAVLLKSIGLTSEQGGFQTKMTHISVNSWVKRFETEGIKGLETRPSRGRKPIMDCSDEEAVRKAIRTTGSKLRGKKRARVLSELFYPP